MKRIVCLVRLLALSMFVLSLGAGPVAATGTPGISGKTLKVKLNEWSLGFSRSKATKGNIKVEVTNVGRYPHNFVVRKKNTGETVYESRTLKGNQVTKTSLNHPSGQDELYCSVPGHRNR